MELYGFVAVTDAVDQLGSWGALRWEDNLRIMMLLIYVDLQWLPAAICNSHWEPAARTSTVGPMPP